MDPKKTPTQEHLADTESPEEVSRHTELAHDDDEPGDTGDDISMGDATGSGQA